MSQTAMGMVLNLIHMLDIFGFIPNGARVYYAMPGRSQPPLLSSMVAEVYQATGNVTFLQLCYTALKAEYSWWMRTGEYGHAVYVAAAPTEGQPEPVTYVLNRYVTDQHIPRPESWVEDVGTAAAAGFGMMSPGAQILYSEIAAAAESGWDFTGRWFGDESNITTCDTVRRPTARRRPLLLPEASVGVLPRFAP